MKADDCTLLPQQLAEIKKQANKALLQADAFGIFPTPVAQVMGRARVTLAPENAFEDGLIDAFRKKFKNKLGVLKKALSKVFGVLDAVARIAYVDATLPIVKQTFLKLHETAHAFLPWQRELYCVVEDCGETIHPDVADAFDREANVFASEVLFQGGSFSLEASDYEFGMNVPLKLSRKYGSSAYSAIRRYVDNNHRSCAVLVLNPPAIVVIHGFVSSLRRAITSTEFDRTLGKITWPDLYSPDDDIGKMIPFGKQRMSGKKTLTISDLNGDAHECIAEIFKTPYQIFVLIAPIQKLTKKIIIF